MQNIDNLKPFPKFCYTIGMIPTSYRVSMSYEEQLLWLCDYLENTVIPTVNNNGNAVTELQNLFVELKNYVDNYFDNLDVQEEINQKLDDMVENGTLLTILSNYANLIKTYNTYNDFIADAENLINGIKIKTLGYNSINDGGDAYYYLTNIANQNEYQITLSENLFATLLETNKIDLRKIGYFENDNIDTIIPSLLDFFNTIEINENYTLSSNCIIENKSYFNINMNIKNRINAEFGFIFKNCSHFYINNLRIFDTYQRTLNTALIIDNSSIFKFNQCQFDGFEKEVVLKDYAYAEFNDCYFIAGQNNTSYGLYAENYFSEQLIMNNCKFDGKYESPSLGTAIHLIGSVFPVFNNCDISNWNTLIAFQNSGGNLKNPCFNNCNFSHCETFINYPTNNETKANFNNCNFDTTGGYIRTTKFINNYYGTLEFNQCNHISTYSYELINSTRTIPGIVKLHFIQFDQATSMTINVPDNIVLDFYYTSYGIFAQKTSKRFFAYNINFSLKAELLYTNNPNYNYQFKPYSQWTGSETRLYFAEQNTSEEYWYIFKVSIIKLHS